MKTVFKKVFCFASFVLLFCAIIVGCKKSPSSNNATVSFISFDIVRISDSSLSNQLEETFLEEENPFGKGKMSIEDKINSTIEVANENEDLCNLGVNEYVYAVIKLDNKNNRNISSIVINDEEYKSGSYEKESTNEMIKIKFNVGVLKGIKEYELKKISYVYKSNLYSVDIKENNVKKVSVGPMSDISVSVSNWSIDESKYEFDLSLSDIDELIDKGLGKVNVLLYDGDNFVRNISVNKSTKVTFDELENDKLYQYAIVAIYDRLDGNGNKLYILNKDTFYTKEFLISSAQTEHGNITVTSKSYGKSTITVSSVADGEYKLRKTYYIEEGKNEKVYFDKTFKMPLNNIVIYSEFEKGYKISTKMEGYGTITVDTLGLCDEIIFATAKVSSYLTVVSEMYYIEEGSDVKNYFWESFVMPKNNVTVVAVEGENINIHNAQELALRLKEGTKKYHYYNICDDINLGGEEWQPIGSEENPFLSQVLGNDHVISNFKITNESQYVGIFAYAKAKISNLHLKDFEIDLSYNNSMSNYVGGLVGYADSGFTISNSTLEGIINVDGNANEIYVGGMAGYFEGKSANEVSYSNSKVEITIDNTSFKAFAGGLVGYAIGDHKTDKEINNSTASGKVYLKDTMNSYLGTIVGYVGESRGQTLQNCYELIDFVEIDTKEELINLQGNVSGNYRLMADIDLEGIEWIPLNLYGGGIFDGNNHKIYNFKITTGRSNNGLFGYASNAQIKNLIIEEASIDYNFNSHTYGSILVGHSNSLLVDNVSASGDIFIETKIEGAIMSGGIVGYDTYGTIITNCSFKGNMYAKASGEGSINCGGIIGLSDNGFLSNNEADVHIEALGGFFVYVGGTIGKLNFGSAEKNYAEIKIICGPSDSFITIVGGLVGDTLNSTVTNSYSKGVIKAESLGVNVGGFVGDSYGSVIRDSYADVDIEANSSGSTWIGGFVGDVSEESKISGCYALGDLNIYSSLSAYVGGFVGEYDEKTELANNFKSENQVIVKNLGEINNSGTSLINQGIWEYVYNNWDKEVWDLHLSKDPTLK